MSDDKYNGYANKETWALCLHIDNDESLQNHWRERAKKCTFGRLITDLEKWVTELRQLVLEGENTTKEARMLIEEVGSIWRVDFYEVAKAISEE